MFLRFALSSSFLSTSGRWSDTIRSLLPYVWRYKARVGLALFCLVLAKVATVAMPLWLKQIVDGLNVQSSLLVLPVGALLGYGLVRLASGVLGELRDVLFARVTVGAVERISSQVFEHLLQLSLRFHMDRQTGGLSRDIERGTKGISFVLNFTVFNILPTLFELALVMGILLWRYDWWFAGVTLLTISVYIVFTLFFTEQRLRYRRAMNQLDSRANTQAMDALLNYETVKYFGNEQYEVSRYRSHLQRWVHAAVRNQVSLNVLNIGQGTIITAGVTALLFMSAQQVVAGQMTVGDVVLVSAFLTQLYAPLNFLGFVYREIKNSLADMERMFALFRVEQEVADVPNAKPLTCQQADVSFGQVGFAYDARRRILQDFSLHVPAGKTVAVVGSSGAGKSTLARLLFRFYDPDAGSIQINGIDIRQYTQQSLREHIGMVPQDTVLFNDTIYHNIAYGRPEATKEQVHAVAQAARIHDFIMALPDAYETMVGERGLKLSGGEKQRVAIARTLLKDPPILVLDEATSALDSRTEHAIQEQLAEISRDRTTLIIAHRLSTVTLADKIIVMEQGQVVEEGKHAELLAKGGVYAQMWHIQHRT